MVRRLLTIQVGLFGCLALFSSACGSPPCDSGFEKNEDGYCIDIDECADDALNDCDANATCTNTNGGYTCTCNDGYTGDGKSCSDVDECADPNLNDCDANATCTNTDGGYTCECNDGYQGNGTFCTDIDECADPMAYNCDPNAACVNTEGGYQCTCLDGFEPDASGNGCVDVDECANDPCDFNASCTNTPGGFTCECDSGYAGDGFECFDVDECVMDPTICGDNAVCTNTEGDYECDCLDGYEMDQNGDCVNVNECADPALNDCDPNATCTDDEPGYTCACNPGYAGDGFTCAPVFQITGTLYDMPNQPNLAGDTVVVRLYPGKSEVIEFVAETTVTVTDGQAVDGTTYTFTDVPEGLYYVRAFRDANGDGWPQLESETQAPSAVVSLFGGDAGADLTLIDYSWFGPFTGDVRIVDLAVNAAGDCAAPHLRATGAFMFGGPPTQIDGPYVHTPTGFDVELDDTRPCVNGSGYDAQPYDGSYTGGVPLNAATSGTYYVWYRGLQEDVFDVRTDDLTAGAALAAPTLQSPDGSVAVDPMNDQASWTTVQGATFYGLFAQELQAWQTNPFSQTTQNTSLPLDGFGLLDGMSYRFWVGAYDADPATDVDFYSESLPVAAYVDYSGTQSATISGDIVNLTGQTGPYVVRLVDRNNGNLLISRANLDSAATTYQLAGPMRGGLALEAWIDLDGDGAYTAGEPADVVESLDLSGGSLTGVEIRFVPPVVLLSPPDEADHQGPTPAFQWEAYPQNAAPQGSWSYLFVAWRRSGGNPEIAWTVESTTTTFDLANPPTNRYDILCAFTGGVYDPGTGACTGGTGSVADLGQDWWAWQVFLVACTYDDAVCLLNAISAGDIYAGSELWTVASVCGPGLADDGQGGCVDLDACAAADPIDGNPCNDADDPNGVCSDQPPPSETYTCSCNWPTQFDANQGTCVLPPPYLDVRFGGCGAVNESFYLVSLWDPYGNPMPNETFQITVGDTNATFTVFTGTELSQGNGILTAQADAGGNLEFAVVGQPNSLITFVAVNSPNAQNSPYSETLQCL